MKKKIKQQQKELREKEKKILLELESGEANLRAKAKTAGKVALVSGLIALVVFWGFKAFSGEPKKKNKKKKKSNKNNSSGRLVQLITPYIVKFLGEVLELDKDSKDHSKSSES